MCRGQIERAKIRPAPGEVGDEFGRADLAEQFTGGRIDPDAAGRRDPDIAAMVALHAVGQTGFELGTDAAGEDARIGERTIGFDIEDADQRLHGVVDVEQALVGREAEAVGLVEQMAVDDKFRRAAAGWNAVDALKAELPRPLDAVDRHAAIPGIAEIDRAVRMHADIVRTVEFLIFEMRGNHLAPSVGPLADQGRGSVLADNEIELGVIGHAVAFVRRTLGLDDATLGIPSPAHIAGHIREQQIVMDRMPDRPLREVKTGAYLADRRVRVDQGFEFRAQRDMRHRSVLSAFRPGTSCAGAGSGPRGQVPDRAAGRPPCRPRSWPGGRGPGADSANRSGVS